MSSSPLIFHLRGSLRRRLSPSLFSLPHLSSVAAAGCGPLHLLHTKSRSNEEDDVYLLIRRPNPRFHHASPFTTACSRGLPSSPSKLVGVGPSSAMISLMIRNYSLRFAKVKRTNFDKRTQFDDTSQRAVTIALWCNFFVFSLKFGVWLMTSSHVMLAEMVHSIADFVNQALLAYGLSSSRRAPDRLHPYGYSKDRFFWSLISAVGIFCLGSGATIMLGIQNLWSSHHLEHITYAALVIGGSFIIEGASLLVAINAVKKGAAAEKMKIWDYIWRGHDPTSVAVMTEDGAAVTGLAIAAASLVAVHMTGNAIYDPIGSIIVGNLLGMVAIFLIQRNRHVLLGRSIDDHDMEQVFNFLKADPIVDSFYDCKTEVIGPGFFRFKVEIDFNGEVLAQNYLERIGWEAWAENIEGAAERKDRAALYKLMTCYGDNIVEALGSEIDRLEMEIQKIVPGIRHVDIEVDNPFGLLHNPCFIPPKKKILSVTNHQTDSELQPGA